METCFFLVRSANCIDGSMAINWRRITSSGGVRKGLRNTNANKNYWLRKKVNVVDN